MKFQLDYLLSQTDPRDAKEAIHSLPKDLKSAYLDMISRIENINAKGIAIHTLLFETAVEQNSWKGGWSKLKYREGLRKLRLDLTSESYEKLLKILWKVFDRYCLCIPACSRYEFIASHNAYKDAAAWINFDARTGERVWIFQNHIGVEEDEEVEYGLPSVFISGSTWELDRDITKENDWAKTVEQLLSEIESE